tara:strand:+ start:35 stop:862 length:828 start_codon:yes stop_codon:yes gene_type:complete
MIKMTGYSPQINSDHYGIKSGNIQAPVEVQQQAPSIQKPGMGNTQGGYAPTITGNEASFTSGVQRDIDSGTAFGQSAPQQSSFQNPGMWNSAGKMAQTGAQSGNYAGMGAAGGGVIGTAVGAYYGNPQMGAAIGTAGGAAGGGMLDQFLAVMEKEENEKKAKIQEKKKKKWEEYSLALEERGRNLEDEKLQYARDDISQQRMLGAQQEMLKTKNAILQSGNMYRSRMGRNWYGPQGITPTTRGGGVAQGTTAKDLGYEGKTPESTRIKNPIGMGY